MNEQVHACAEWFRENPAFHRLLIELRKKYRGFGKPAGKVTIPDASEEECEAAKGLFCRDFSAPLVFKTADFETALQDTRFGCVSLKEVLEAYFGGEIKTARECRTEQDRRFSSLLETAAQASESAACRAWLEALGNRQAGSDALKRAADKNEEAAQRALLRACRGMEQVEQGKKLRLAVLSALAVGDPHALDSGTLCGRLFLYALAFRTNQGFPTCAEQRDALYFQNGILCDSISSCVAQLGLVLETEEGEHPAYRAFRQRHELCSLTLSEVSRLTGARSPSGRAYLVENEGVFCQLCDQAERFHSPLICTSGQPSVAAVQLLELLAAAGTELFYSGDFEGMGLSIAASLASRWPDRIRLWHLSKEDYLRCRSDEALTPASTALLDGCIGTVLEATAAAVKQNGLAGYQELLLPMLEKDLTVTP